MYAAGLQLGQALGVGDIYPTGHLRMLAGVKSLNGFLLISSSASFIYLVKSKSAQQEGSRE